MKNNDEFNMDPPRQNSSLNTLANCKKRNTDYMFQLIQSISLFIMFFFQRNGKRVDLNLQVLQVFTCTYNLQLNEILYTIDDETIYIKS